MKTILAALLALMLPLSAAAHLPPVGTTAEMRGSTPVRLALGTPAQGAGLACVLPDPAAPVLLACAGQ